MKFKYLTPLIALLITGCVTAPVVTLSEAGLAVKVGKSDPRDNYSEIGPITASDGASCGGYGYRGTYNRAVTNLKNKAAMIGGDYVQIFSLTEPHSQGGCFNNLYKISGTLFKKTAKSPTPLSIKQTNENSSFNKLRELKKLLDEGIINQNEYSDQKEIILNSGL